MRQEISLTTKRWLNPTYQKVHFQCILLKNNNNFGRLRCVQGQMLLKRCLVLSNVTQVCQLVLLCFGLFNVEVTDIKGVFMCTI